MRTMTAEDHAQNNRFKELLAKGLNAQEAAAAIEANPPARTEALETLGTAKPWRTILEQLGIARKAA